MYSQNIKHHSSAYTACNTRTNSRGKLTDVTVSSHCDNKMMATFVGMVTVSLLFFNFELRQCVVRQTRANYNRCHRTSLPCPRRKKKKISDPNRSPSPHRAAAATPNPPPQLAASPLPLPTAAPPPLSICSLPLLPELQKPKLARRPWRRSETAAERQSIWARATMLSRRLGCTAWPALQLHVELHGNR